MATGKKLGAYLESNGLFIVETRATTPSRVFHIPFSEEAQNALFGKPTGLSNIKVGSDLHKVLQDQDLDDSSINLSLSAGDIIFRSFVIPWMEEHEIKRVVEFEASKYVPFALEKLAFAYHPISFTTNNKKSLRIIFVAIKSSTLSNYIKVLENASLRINLIEPAPSSLIRALSFKLRNIIPKDQAIAIIEKGESGRITITDNDIPQFVREFHLATIDGQGQSEESQEESTKKLVGEVRISLDYFNRQNEELQVTQAILLSESNLQELSQTLEKSLPISVTPVDDQSVLGDPSIKELSYLNAYGASIISAINAPVYFNLSKTPPKTVKKRKAPIARNPINYKAIMKTALVCIPLIIGSIGGSNFAKQKFNNDIRNYNEQLGPFQDADVSMIEEKETSQRNKLTYFRKTRMDSNAAVFLLLIPNLLPEGVWLKNLDIVYDDSAAFELGLDKTSSRNPIRRVRRSAEDTPFLLVTIDGYAYSQKRNEQFELVNQLLRNLNDNREFSGYFTNIDVETTEAQQLDEYSVMSFKILCKRNDES